MKRFDFFRLIFFLSFVIFTRCLGNSNSDQEKTSKINDIDIVIISNNSPIKLYACLESINYYVKGYNKIFVFYSANNANFEQAYKNVWKKFPDVAMIQCELDGKDAYFKSMLCKLLLRNMKSKYVALTVDEVIVKDSVNLDDCLFAFEKSDIYGFCLNLGKNITQDSFVFLKSIKQISENIISWNIHDCVKGLFAKPFDMVIYNRTVILNTNLRGLRCQSVNDLTTAWVRSIDKNLNMACFDKSKAITVTPLIFQNKLKKEEMNKSFLENKLLFIFSSGFKININTFYDMDNKTSSLSYEVSFIPRNNENGELWKKLKNKITKENKHFVFVIASYNNKQWYRPNLDSVFSQKYKNYSVIYADDNSPDGTGNLVEQYIKERKLENKFLLIKNQERFGAVANIYNAIHMCDDKDIIIILDGDDWLTHDHVLDLLNRVYDDQNIWLTYGQFVRFPNYGTGFCKKFQPDDVKNSMYRSCSWIASHLRTFYAGLYKKIKKEDLMIDDKFLSISGDLAIMFPMLEMTGGRFMFIPDVLHVYNYDTPLNDFKNYREYQIEIEKHIRSLSPYDPLDENLLF